jgi:hypothetical protein
MQAMLKSTRKRLRPPHNPLLENKLARSEQFQELKKELKKESLTLMDEMKTKHVQIFYNWINSKLHCIDEILKLVDQNPILSINELAKCLEQKIETEARTLNKTKEFSRMEAICNRLSALEWTRNIINTIYLKYRIV